MACRALDRANKGNNGNTNNQGSSILSVSASFTLWPKTFSNASSSGKRWRPGRNGRRFGNGAVGGEGTGRRFGNGAVGGEANGRRFGNGINAGADAAAANAAAEAAATAANAVTVWLKMKVSCIAGADALSKTCLSQNGYGGK